MEPRIKVSSPNDADLSDLELYVWQIWQDDNDDTDAD